MIPLAALLLAAISASLVDALYYLNRTAEFQGPGGNPKGFVPAGSSIVYYVGDGYTAAENQIAFVQYNLNTGTVTSRTVPGIFFVRDMFMYGSDVFVAGRTTIPLGRKIIFSKFPVASGFNVTKLDTFGANYRTITRMSMTANSAVVMSETYSDIYNSSHPFDGLFSIYRISLTRFDLTTGNLVNTYVSNSTTAVSESYIDWQTKSDENVVVMYSVSDVGGNSDVRIVEYDFDMVPTIRGAFSIASGFVSAAAVNPFTFNFYSVALAGSNQLAVVKFSRTGIQQSVLALPAYAPGPTTPLTFNSYDADLDHWYLISPGTKTLNGPSGSAVLIRVTNGGTSYDICELIPDYPYKDLVFENDLVYLFYQVTPSSSSVIIYNVTLLDDPSSVVMSASPSLSIVVDSGISASGGISNAPAATPGAPAASSISRRVSERATQSSAQATVSAVSGDAEANIQPLTPTNLYIALGCFGGSSILGMAIVGVKMAGRRDDGFA